MVLKEKMLSALSIKARVKVEFTAPVLELICPFCKQNKQNLLTALKLVAKIKFKQKTLLLFKFVLLIGFDNYYTKLY